MNGCRFIRLFAFLIVISTPILGQGQVTGAVLFGGGGGIIAAPFCGTRESQTRQTLEDGTHIVRKTQTQFCRDSQGRTRTEIFSTDPSGEVSSSPIQINIVDPVDHVQYFLDVKRSVARRIAPFPPAPPAQLKPALGAPTAPLPPPPPRQEQRPEITKEDLGSQVLEGVLVEGNRITTTYPTGSFGNDRPFAAVNETWFSKDLREVILSKRSDPRTGETVQQLAHIDRSEPDPTLFRIPADYTVEDMPVSNAR